MDKDNPEQYKKFGPFKIDRRKVIKTQSYIFIVIFMALWTGISVAYGSTLTSENHTEYIIWFLGLLFAAFKKTVIDVLDELRNDVRTLLKDKQDKDTCKKLHGVKNDN